MLNSQKMAIGNAAGGLRTATTIVRAKNVSQNQSGMLNSQSMNLGNAD
jgi:hypothetical protein